MSIYGEGLYAVRRAVSRPGLAARGPAHVASLGHAVPELRATLRPRPTPESKPLAPTSIYAVNKRDQEEMVLTRAHSLGIPAIALRFFNVYGDRQALSNPYTGVAAIFSSCLLNARRPPVFEDGQQARDFVHVSDVVSCLLAAVEADAVTGGEFNVGTGKPTSLLDLLALLRKEIRDVEPEVLGRFREGDVRTCYAERRSSRERLGFEPRDRPRDGVRSLASWVASQQSVDNNRRRSRRAHTTPAGELA